MPGVPHYDAVVIGGGPAGLTGALYLARFRRSVLLIDDGQSRASRIPRSHNYPGFADGVVGAELVAAMQRQAQRHDVVFETGRVTSLEESHQGFEVRWASRNAFARTVLLATGARDVEPTMPHLVEALREGALRYCPVCDGYEVIGQVVGVLCDSKSDLEEAVFLRHFAEQVKVYTVSADVHFSDHECRLLKRGGIAVVPEPVSSIRLRDGKIAVRHGERESICDSMYGALGLQVQSQLALALGAQADAGGYLRVDRRHRTPIAGLYAAGDVAAGLNQISVATGGAAIAAAAMHQALRRNSGTVLA